ncbi:uncharacterized protein DEA37_0011108 [Paragonimus westermani]|uniref:Uncharacterized protein n=1 Tax=Paragonimus westermani TaxID=34504 RepID=A0A5J4N858_9TREM|nr:uncharacterized protein DEA37_0011108 [Paragonimus westermani]
MAAPISLLTCVIRLLSFIQIPNDISFRFLHLQYLTCFVCNLYFRSYKTKSLRGIYRSNTGNFLQPLQLSILDQKDEYCSFPFLAGSKLLPVIGCRLYGW